ncbi:MAG: putative transrane anti-sigma factor [Bryobacterales bacterium]|nr:putative transrane anti-sigma factor [Bryobacterales bacterium]
MTDCPMKSEEQMDRLLAYCAGRLDADTARTLERHMDACSACAAFRNSQSAVWNALDAWETPSVSADFNRKLYARIDAEDAIPWYRRWLHGVRPVFAQPALPLAVAALVVVAGFQLDHPARVTQAPRDPVATATTRVSVTEAEQVEKTLEDLEMLRQFDVSSEQPSEKKEKPSKSM